MFWWRAKSFVLGLSADGQARTNWNLNPDPSHEPRARRIGPACRRQAPGKSTASVPVMWKDWPPAAMACKAFCIRVRRRTH